MRVAAAFLLCAASLGLAMQVGAPLRRPLSARPLSSPPSGAHAAASCRALWLRDAEVIAGRRRARTARMVSLIDTSASESEIWLQAFAPYFVLAALKVSIALTSEDPAKRASPAGIATWLGLSGGLYAAIIYRNLHPVGSELVATVAGALAPFV